MTSKVIFLAILSCSLLLSAAAYDPLVQTGTIPLTTDADDLLFHGGYLYGVSQDALTVYDLLGGMPVLKATIPIEHSEILPRLYRYKTTLILSYFNDYTDNGLRFYDITNPLQPALLYVFRPKRYPDYGHINSGFNSECRGTCKVAKNLILCAMNMKDEDPCTNSPWLMPFALDIRTMQPIILVPSDGQGSFGLMSFEYYAGIAFFQGAQDYCPFWIDPVIKAVELGSPWITLWMYCSRFCEWVCPTDPIGRYKQWVFFGLIGPIGGDNEILDKNDLSGGGSTVSAPYDTSCDYTPSWERNVQTIVGHENWIYGTEYGCQWVYNFDPREEYPFSGVNVMSQPLYGMAIVNDVIYASGGDTLYTFDPVNHDAYRPQGTVNVKEDGTLLTFYGTAVDDDDIRGVYLRVDDEWMKGEEYEEPLHLEYFDYYPVRRHENPFPSPVRWEVTLDRNDLTPGTHTARIIAVDFEGSFAVIGEKEIVIGAGGKAKKRNPGGGGR